jgi:predicted dehydrogenase
VDVDLEVDRTSGSGEHRAIYANFVQAVQDHAPLIADGAEGRLSLELANALIFSSARREQVELPLDRQAYHELLEQLRDAHRITVD